MSSASSTGAREASNARESLEPPPTTAQTRPQACERCWKRKQKCDRRLPACNSCSVLGVECIPRNQDFNTISELSHTSVVGYVASLKRRVADLEEESFSRKRSRTYSCRADSIRDQSSDHDNVARSRDATSVLSSQAMHPAGSNGHDNDDSSVRATMGAIGFLSRSAMAEPRDNSDDLPRKFSLAEVIAGALAIDGRDPSTATPAPQSPGITNHLASVSQVSTLEHVRKFLEWPALLPYLDEDIFLRQCLHSTAIKELPSVLRTEMALEHIHCMIMLLIYSLFNSSGGSAWHLLGLAVKTCISLGLHREPDAHSNLTISEATRRRWLFWTVYYFDRMISLVMDRPVSIQDDDISVRLPMEDGHVPGSADVSSKRKKGRCSAHL
ncbi:Protein STB5 [Colletotrichum tropicale]|nr:Protein STB5 [Colletotrichum tropicale]